MIVSRRAAVARAVLCCLVSACAGPSPSSTEDAVPLAGLIAQAPGTRFSVGSRLQLEAWVITRAGAKVKASPRWVSSDEATVSVDAQGLARTHRPGRVRIEAFVSDVRGQLFLDVKESTVLTLDLFPSDLFEVPRGLMPQLRAFATFSDGSRRDVTAEVEWSAGRGVTLLQQPGHVRFDLEGAAEVVGRLGGVEARKPVMVLPAEPISLRLEALQPGLRPGDLTTLRALAFFTDGSTRDVSTLTRFESMSPTFAVDGPAARALSPGMGLLQARYQQLDSRLEVKVNPRFVTALWADLAHVDLPQGRSVTPRLIAAFDDGTTRDVGTEALWESSLPETARVEAGRVIAGHQGLAVLTARYGGELRTVTVLVQPPVLEGLSVSLPPVAHRLIPGQQGAFVVLGQFSDGARLNVSHLALVRRTGPVSSVFDSEVITFQALGVGQGQLEVEFGGLTRTIELELADVRLQQLTLHQRFPDSARGTSVMQALATWSDGRITDVTEFCGWWSADSEAVTVDTFPGQRGVLRARGRADISARLLDITTTVSIPE